MLRRCLRMLPRLDKDYDEVKYRQRVLGPKPEMKLDWFRDKRFQDKFREFGPEWARIWVHLPGRVRRRRAGRPKDFNDSRYYWQPLRKDSMKLYLSRFRETYQFTNRHYKPPRLHRTNEEIAALRSGPEFEKSGWRKRYGVGDPVAPAPRRDWEYRVY